MAAAEPGSSAMLPLGLMQPSKAAEAAAEAASAGAGSSGLPSLARLSRSASRASLELASRSASRASLASAASSGPPCLASPASSIADSDEADSLEGGPLSSGGMAAAAAAEAEEAPLSGRPASGAATLPPAGPQASAHTPPATPRGSSGPPSLTQPRSQAGSQGAGPGSWDASPWGSVAWEQGEDGGSTVGKRGRQLPTAIGAVLNRAPVQLTSLFAPAGPATPLLQPAGPEEPAAAAAKRAGKPGLAAHCLRLLLACVGSWSAGCLQASCTHHTIAEQLG